MPSTNLDFNIVAKTGQALGEIRLLKAQIQDLGRSLRAAVKAGDTAGAQGISQNIGKMEAQLRGMNRTLAQTAVAGEEAAAGIAFAARSFRTLEGAVLGIGRSFAGARAGLVAFAAFKGFEALIKNLDEVDDRLRKIQERARGAGVDPLGMQAAGRQAQAAGKDAEVGQAAFERFGKAVDEAKAKTAKEDTGGVKVIRGTGLTPPGDIEGEVTPRFITTGVSDINNLVKTIHGGKIALVDFNDAMTALGVQFNNIKTPEDKVTAYTNAMKRAVDLGKQFPMEMNALTQKFFGMPLETLKEITESAPKMDALIKQLSGSAAGANEANLKQINELDKARNRVVVAWEELDAAFANSLRQFRIDNTNALADFLTTTLPAWGEGVSEFFKNFWPNIVAEMQKSWETFNTNFVNNFGQSLQQMFDGWGKWFEGLWETATSWAGKIGETLKGMVSFGGSGAVTPTPAFALGGMVRGPGSTTSDSILARLSNGEFVMSAGAVQRWGAGLLASMNGGGALIPRNGRYAAGGLVAAAGGTPVHLHLGGHSFALSGNEGVVSALVTEAHRQRMRSAGTKPSWYGGH